MHFPPSMDELLQTYEAPYRDGEGRAYHVQIHARSRPGNTWQGWIVFVGRQDGLSYATDVETTQPSAEMVLHWAAGLSATYFDGAFERARRAHRNHSTGTSVPPPLYDATASATTYRERLSELERAILDCFSKLRTPQLATRAVLDELPHANADVVRALEDLEKQGRFLVRRTEAGNDWLLLTEAGLNAAGLSRLPHTHDVVENELPKNAR